MADLRYPVSIAGRGFLVSRKGGRFGRRSIPLQKAQQDTSDAQGEQSLNPEDLWRRSFESWHRGAGQPSFDRAGGDPFRFDNSLGVDPWEQWQLGLLPDTDRKLASVASGIRLVVAGTYLYCADGQTLRYIQTIPAAGVATWTTVTGTPAATITGIASDGFRVWTAHGASGIYSTDRGSASATKYNDLEASSLAFVKGRLMAGRGEDIYNITNASGSTVTFRSATSSTTGSDLYKSVAKPPGIRQGDLLAIVVATRPWINAMPRSITGFTLAYAADANQYEPSVAGQRLYSNRASAAGINGALYVYTRIAQATEPDEYMVALDGPGEFIVAALAYESVNQEIFYDSANFGYNSTATTSAPASEVTTNFTNDLLAYIGFAFGNVTFTPPTGMAERLDTALASGAIAIEVADKTQAGIGASGTQTATLSASATSLTLLLAFRAGTAPDPLFTHPSPDFAWVGFAEGLGDIYAAGFSGDKSVIYRTQIRPDGTALDVPVVAGALPDGEIVRSIYGYLGLIFIGTDGGLRMATSDANGDLTIGALIETPAPVRCFEGQGQYVWFGYENFDVSAWASGTYDGLGRLDLTQQTGALVPAYASDLMVPASTGTTEAVQSIVTFGDRRVFSIADQAGASRGVYASTDQKVATGYLDSGLITYGIADTKVATYLDVRSKPLVGTLEAYLSTDSGAFSSIGTSTGAGSTRPTEPLNAGPSRGDTHEVRIRLNRASSTDAVGPTVTRLTLRSEPAPSRGRIYQVPLILSHRLNLIGHEVSVDPAEALAFIEGLFDTQTLVDYREGATTTRVFVKDYEFVAEHQTGDRRSEQGICVVTLKAPGS